MPNSRVMIGAAQAAWDQVSGLRSVDDPSGAHEVPELSERIAAATAGGALQQIGAGQPGGEQFSERFIETLMRKIVQRWDAIVEASDLPMVRQVVTCAFAGHNAVAWRGQAGPVPDSEMWAMTCALTEIAGFVDRVDGPGACERVLLDGLASGLE